MFHSDRQAPEGSPLSGEPSRVLYQHVAPGRKAQVHEALARTRQVRKSAHCKQCSIAGIVVSERGASAQGVGAGRERADQGCAEHPHTSRVRGRGGRLRAVVATMHVGPGNGAARTHRAHSMAPHASAAQAHAVVALHAQAAGAGTWRIPASATLRACGRRMWSTHRAPARDALRSCAAARPRAANPSRQGDAPQRQAPDRRSAHHRRRPPASGANGPPPSISSISPVRPVVKEKIP